jgi:hypothetical protein
MLLAIVAIADHVPSLREALSGNGVARLAAFVFVAGLLTVLNVWMGIILWTGRISAWNWNSPQTGYERPVLRSKEPLSYWFRVVLVGLCLLFMDAAIAFGIANGKFA